MVEKYTLKNGIPVFIVKNSASPVVSIQAWVTRGSIHEPDKLAGISHFLEHAVFKGTKKRLVGQVALEIESRGGEINAFTSFEETAYYTCIASRYFSDGLDIIADMVINPKFDWEEMEKEKEVIIEEIKRAQDSPLKVVSTNLWKSCFAPTPYGRPVLGFEETVRKINAKTLKDYFKKNYHTGTISVFIVGDVDPKAALKAVTKQFSKAQKGPHTKQKPFSFARSSKIKMMMSGRDLKETYTLIGIRAPEISDPLIPSLDLLCSVIGQGESSRLHQRLVKEKKIAMEAHMGLVATRHCAMATLDLVTAPENAEKAVHEAMNLLREVAAEGIAQSEIERVKSSLESDVIYGKETVEGYARRLGYYYCQFDDPSYEKKYLEDLMKVDEPALRNALNQLLAKTPAISIVHPLNTAPDKQKIESAFTPNTKRPTAPTKSAVLPAVSLQLSRRGSVRFITKTARDLPVIAARILFPGGMREESRNQYGIANLFQRVWTSGTKSYGSLELAQTLESLGASIHAFSGKNTVGLAVECLSKHWPVIHPLLSEVLLTPSFPDEEFNTEKELLLRDILSEKDSPGSLCHMNFLEMLYPNHVYGRSSLGTYDTVKKLAPSDLRDFYKQYIHQAEMVVSAVGSFEEADWMRNVERICAQLPASGKKTRALEQLKPANKFNCIAATKQPLFQSHVLIGFMGASFTDAERFPLKLLSSCLAGQGGRLFLELRDKLSLAYQVAPIQSDGPERGVFGFYIGCSPEKLEKALSGIRTEIDRVLNQPMPEKELERAKEYWIGRFELEMQRYSAQSILYGLDEIYGLGYRHSLEVPAMIKSITAKQIQAAAQKILLTQTPTISIVHPTRLDNEQIEKAWTGKSETKRPNRMIREAVA